MELTEVVMHICMVAFHFGLIIYVAAQWAINSDGPGHNHPLGQEVDCDHQKSATTSIHLGHGQDGDQDLQDYLADSWHLVAPPDWDEQWETKESQARLVGLGHSHGHRDYDRDILIGSRLAPRPGG
nr:hypothetical protein Iba_chr07dCG0090 [Ipomoea batatas]